MAGLRLMCGPAGSGKSTCARDLEAHGGVRFSIDREAYAAGFTDAFVVDAALMERYLAGFEPPSSAESDVRVIDVTG